MFTNTSSVVSYILLFHHFVLGENQSIRGSQNIKSRKTQSDSIELELTSFPDKCAAISLSSNCLQSRPSDKGCDTKLCENAVCKCDPYCCEIAWDSSCIEVNFFSPGCTANDLCCVLNQEAYGKIKTQSDTIGLELVSPKDSCADISPSSNCLESRPSEIGCDTKLCENAVCKCDPYCCEVAWDSSCIKENSFSPGCTANELCCVFNQEGEIKTQSDTIELELISPEDSCADILPSSNCLESRPSEIGCDTKLCENAVCKCDPYCCEVAWDSSCIKQNSFSPGCTANELCCISNQAALGGIVITVVPNPSNPVGDAEFGGKKYKVGINYSTSSCEDLLCIDRIIVQDFSEISSADGIILDVNLREDMGLNTKTLAWAGQVQNGIGSANFLQVGDDLMGSVLADGYVMQFSTVDGIMYVDVIPQGNFPND